VLPPVFPPWPLAAALLAGAAPHAAGAVGGALGGQAAASAGAGGAAGAGTAAGGPMLASGSLAGKLVAGCLLAFGVGVGCVALNRPTPHSAHPHASAEPLRRGAAAPAPVEHSLSSAAAGSLRGPAAPATGPPPSTRLTRRVASIREFRPEQAAGAAAVPVPTGGLAARTAAARTAAAGTTSAGTTVAGTGAAPSSFAPLDGARAAAPSAAQREFGPG
jgi:hypothetical protein